MFSLLTTESVAEQTLASQPFRITKEYAAMAKAPKRRVFHSILTRSGWEMKEARKTISRHDSQKEAEFAAIAAGRNTYVNGGIGQAVLHKTDGTIREQRTYGGHPERRAP
jgi:hypothetical protein